MKTSEIADFLSATLVGDGDVDIRAAASIDKAGEGEIAFVEKASSIDDTGAACLIVPQDFAETLAAVLIKTAEPRLAFARIAGTLHPRTHEPSEIHKTAIISDSAVIEGDVFIGAYTTIADRSRIGTGSQLGSGTTIGRDVSIGTKCVLHQNVVIEDGCTIGDSVILHSGVVIGADGFGYVRDTDRYIKFPQIGTVVIENDVEIGANTCIDRGALGETRVGNGTKIDNLVQIAHNVRIGKRVIIAAQTGISGSTVIEDDCVIGGQVGMGDHALVKAGAVIGSQAGVLPGKIVRPGVWWGTPVQPLDEFKRQNALVKGLGRLKDKLREIEEQIRELKN